MKIKYKIVAEHPKKGFIEIPIKNSIIHSVADMSFIMDECEECWENFTLNKIDKDILKFFKDMTFLAYDVDSDGYVYQEVKQKNKDLKIKFKKVKSDWVMVKKPIWKKK